MFLTFEPPNPKSQPMKRSLQWLIVYLISVLLSGSVSAKNPESHLLFSITSQNTARLGIVNKSKRSIDLTISNYEGNVIYTRSVSGNQNYFQLYSLANMPDGEYIVAISNLEEIESKRFRIINSSAYMVREQKDLPPTFRLVENNTLYVSYLNAKKIPVNIFIMKKDDVLFEERGIAESGISKRYSLQKLPAGEYEVRLYSAGKIYSHILMKE